MRQGTAPSRTDWSYGAAFYNLGAFNRPRWHRLAGLFCAWWFNPSAPHSGSMEAARYPPRLAALRCPSLMNECGNAGENGTVCNRRRAWRGLIAVVAGEIGVYAKFFALKLWNEPEHFSDVASPRLQICRG